MILDFQMPRMNGLQVIEHIKGYIARQNMLNQYVQLEEPRFVIVSNYLTESLEKHMARYNVRDFYEKPLPDGVLQSLVRQMEMTPEHSNVR
jgi:CheY-like chemotaxis protein